MRSSFSRLGALLLSSSLIGVVAAQLQPDAIRTRDAALTALRKDAPLVMTYSPGASIERVYGVPFGVGVTAEDSFNVFMLQYAGLFTPGQGELRLESTQSLKNGEFIAGYFQEYLNNIPVDRGFVTLVCKSQIGFPLVLASSNAKYATSPAGMPKISASAIVNVYRQRRPTMKYFSKPSLVIWMGETTQHLAWTFQAGDIQPQQTKSCGCLPVQVQGFVDARTGAILEERNLVYSVDVSGNVKGWATPGLKPDQGNNPETLQPLELLRVNISGGNSALTNALGDYTIVNAGSSPVTVNATLVGQWASVENQAAPTLSLSQVVTPPGPANFIFNPGMAEFDTAQVNGFIQVTRVHNFAKSINPSYPGIDISIPTRINVVGSCNAFYSGSTVNFYRSGGSCPNMAYSTVIWHEYGHFIIESGHPGATGDYHEGVADVTANLLGDTPWVGEDFSGQGTGPLRSAYNSQMYPNFQEAHTAGQVISGAFWLTLDQLNLTIGHNAGLNLIRQLYLNSILMHPTGINPGVTIDVLTLDDNDGNLLNGTPHYSEIANGFGAKNLRAPRVPWVTFDSINTPGESVPPNVNEVLLPMRFQVRQNVGEPNTQSVVIHYRVNEGPWNTAATGEYADPGLMFGAIELAPRGSSVDWYVSCLDTQGRNTNWPLNAPEEPFNFIVANSLTTLFEDTFETDRGWTVANDASLVTGAWVRANPNGTDLNGVAANPENDSPDPGTQCFFTGQGTVGGAVGDQDVDGGPTQLTSPVINLAGTDAFIEFKRWYFNDDGDDAFVVEVSNNNGASWVTVEGVTGILNSWVQRRFRVGQFVTPTASVRVRFSAADNPNNSITEAAIDQFVVKRIN